jgi:hypothetical protein
VRHVHNPWRQLEVPAADYRLPMDTGVVLNPVVYPPQPWLGSFDRGRVLWLLGGFGTGIDMAIDRDDCRPQVLAWVKENLAADLPSTPNAWLGRFPELEEFAGSRDTAWWLSKTAALQTALGGGDEARHLLAERLFVLEAHPYPARTNPKLEVPSMAFTAHLLSQWLESSRPVVIARAARFWTDLVPALGRAVEAGKAFVARNPQQATISAGNLTDADTFPRLVRALSE